MLPATIWALPVRNLLNPLGDVWKRRLLGVFHVLFSLVIVATGARIVTDAAYISTRRGERFGWCWNDDFVPVKAAEFADRERLPGRMLNHLNFGGYLMWARQEPVFIDGRTEVMGVGFYKVFERAMTDPAALETCVARYGITWIIFPHGLMPELVGRLSVDENWRLAYADNLAAIFRRNDGTLLEEPVVTAMPVRRTQVVDLPGLGGGPRDIGIPKWLAGFWKKQEFPSEDHCLGLFHLYRGESALAEVRFAAAIMNSRGAYYEHYNNLGAALFRQGRWEEALRCYLVVLRERPEETIARRRIEEIRAAME
ncbi:hypothetical protein JW905_06320, partial [bacterium]|nr:hypothetical protein [candidate division CSSED10-310 bacterium]